MGQHDNYLVKYAEGKAKNLGKARNKITSWKEFYTDLSTPTVTGEKRSKFDSLSKDEQDVLKAVAGWISTAQCEGNTRSLKTILPRNLMSLDLDYCSVELLEAIEKGKASLSQFESVIHSSRRHTTRKPRLRMFLPLSRDVDADEYHSLVRIVSWILDGKRDPIIQVDRVSARPAQMMFKPTISKDGDWFYKHQTGKLLDPDTIFSLWRKKMGDPFDLSKLPLFDTETTIRKTAEKSENPLTKPGIIGAFCRAYSITEAMDAFLPGVYIPGDTHSEQPRYTYAGSTSSNGAIIYDDDLFLYSNHGHDPCCEQNVNAYDLVRLHLYGDLDKDIDVQNTPINQLPSSKAMLEFAKNDKGAKRELLEERYAFAQQFDDESDESESPEEEPPEEDLIGNDPAPKKKKGKKDSSWQTLFALDKQGRVLPTIFNYSLILQNDHRLAGAFSYNEFTGQYCLRRSIFPGLKTVAPKICDDPLNGQKMEDDDDSVVRSILDAPAEERGYEIPVIQTALRDAIVVTGKKNPFHPVKDYLESIKWDGVKRVDTFLIRHLNLEDTRYHREVSRLKLLASVVRVYEPGHKFDYMAILGGPQGIRKSTFIRELYSSRWFGELDCKLDDKREITETIAGLWGSEMPEMDSFKKAESTTNKKFMRKQEYTVRAAYAHRANTVRVQTVFWGTTNEKRYLRDPSGNRSYWPLLCGFEKGEHIDTDAVRAERDQLWAEALVLYRQMRQDMPKSVVPTLPLTLSEEASVEAVTKQEAARAEEVFEEIANQMFEKADEPIRLSDLLREYGNASTRFTNENETDPDTILVRRCALTRRDLMRFAFGEHIETLSDQIKKTNFDRALETFTQRWEAPSGTPRKKFGGLAVGRWFVRKGINRTAANLGYEIVSEDLIG